MGEYNIDCIRNAVIRVIQVEAPSRIAPSHIREGTGTRNPVSGSGFAVEIALSYGGV